jgi:hypothetical protein
MAARSPVVTTQDKSLTLDEQRQRKHMQRQSKERNVRDSAAGACLGRETSSSVHNLAPPEKTRRIVLQSICLIDECAASFWFV